MRRGRAILAVGAGLAITAPCTIVLSAQLMPSFQEVAAAVVPQWAPDWMYIAFVGSLVTGLVTLPAIIVAVLIAGRPSKPRPGYCRACGYDLTGDLSGKCPECGEAT